MPPRHPVDRALLKRVHMRLPAIAQRCVRAVLLPVPVVTFDLIRPARPSSMATTLLTRTAHTRHRGIAPVADTVAMRLGILNAVIGAVVPRAFLAGTPHAWTVRFPAISHAVPASLGILNCMIGPVVP